MKGQKIEDVKTNLMKSTVLAMSTAIAISLAISVIYFVILLQTQSAEIPDSFKLASLLGSSVLVIWTTSTFWAEVKKLTATKESVSSLFPTKEGIQQATKPTSTRGMRIRIGTVEIREPDITKVNDRGWTPYGFEFAGLAPEEKGKRIVDQLNAIKQEDDQLECEALTNKGKPMSGYGKLEDLEIQVLDTAPVMYRFSGKVRLAH
jgi:hypothetical protein